MSEVSLYPAALDSTNLYEVVARLSTTLTADIDATTTTIPLASTTGFPTKGYIVIDNETIEYISVSVGSVDATGGRGHAGTAASHTNTTQVLVAVTAAVFNKLRAGLIAVQTKVGISASADTTSHDYKLSGITGTDKAVSKTGTETLINKTLTSPVINNGVFTGGGALSSKIVAVTRDMTSASGDVSYTGVGFTPTSILCIAILPGSYPLSIGFADSGKASSEVSQYGANTFTQGDHLVAIRVGDNTQIAVVASYDADGFTLTWTQTGSVTGIARLKFLCFR